MLAAVFMEFSLDDGYQTADWETLGTSWVREQPVDRDHVIDKLVE